MPTQPTPHSSFTVSSGAVCFGDLHNIWDGAGAPLQPFRNPPPEPRRTGTVRTQPLEFNTPAANGKWLVYELKSRGTTTGWFASHTDIDPDAEIRKIVRVSGHPSDIDPGSSYNDKHTAQNGVFVLNRYDWGYYDRRSEDAVVLSPQSEEFTGEGVGIVDRAEARVAVDQWKARAGSQRQATVGGVWLEIPYGEYKYGRFGYDDAHTVARSFLFFNTYTEFTQTTFACGGETIKRVESDQERFERRLREEYDFAGIEWLREALPPPNPDPNIIYHNLPAPPRTDWLGPYDPSEHILGPAEMAAVFSSPLCTRPADEAGTLSADAEPLFERWGEKLRDLINEMVMSYLQRVVAPNMRDRSLSDAANALYPPRGPENRGAQLDKLSLRHFAEDDSSKQPLPGFDSAGVGGRIKDFLQRVAGPNAVFEDACVAGMTRVVAFLLEEILELAETVSLDVSDIRIMPRHVRITVYSDVDLYEYFKFSRVYWEGRG